ncbi:MAG: SEC-C metal-binding domain-containing protein [Lacrimispora sp.]|uniref:IS1096 element passenger TnpR family protein n=1 Tax=Lacrimispora sp. TaxID=2719234 RepID=UPI0039E4CE91
MGAYQLKITIKGSKPPIWRRVLIPEGITFEDLHRIIQTAFDRTDDHLYEFEFRSEGVRVAPGEEDRLQNFEYRLAHTVIDQLVSGANKFIYTCNNWEYSIQAEDGATDYKESFARVIKFKGDSVPESCKDMAGYYELLEQSSKKIKSYDVDDVNKLLSRNGNQGQEEVHIRDIYECYDKNSLLEIGRRHRMSGLSKLKKEELAEQIIAHILDKEVMSSYFLCARDSEIKLFEQIAAGNRTVLDSELEMDFLYAGGYVTAKAEGGFAASEEVIKAYKEWSTPEFEEKRRRLSKIGDYLLAANSLYAVTPPSVVLETFNKYESSKLTLEELLQAYELLLPYRCLVVYVDGSFADGALMEQNGLKELLKMQKKVPYYIPTQPEIRSMADNSGFIMTEELDRLGKFLSDEMNVPKDRIPYILHQVQAELSTGGQIQDVIDDLKEAEVVFENDEQTKAFSPIINDVWNHTRMVLNRGHKPYEMVMRGLEDKSIQRKNIEKVYPNDPCPCGSGKKHKKCCAKKN